MPARAASLNRRISVGGGQAGWFFGWAIRPQGRRKARDFRFDMSATQVDLDRTMPGSNRGRQIGARTALNGGRLFPKYNLISLDGADLATADLVLRQDFASADF